jgi:hypothetical protein
MEAVRRTRGNSRMRGGGTHAESPLKGPSGDAPKKELAASRLLW